MRHARAVEQLIHFLGLLPGVGQKTSERLAYHLLRAPAEQTLGLAKAIETALRTTKVCSTCCNLDETDPCTICADTSRDQTRLLVVEDPRDLRAFEDGGWRGMYHVLHGRISSLDGIGQKDLTLERLFSRATPGAFQEIILATNPDLEGEGTAQWIGERLGGKGANVTRIARGIPAGASITQVGKGILADALEGRRPLPPP